MKVIEVQKSGHSEPFRLKEWCGIVESEKELFLNQEIELNTKACRGKILITQKKVGSKIYHFVGLGKLESDFV